MENPFMGYVPEQRECQSLAKLSEGHHLMLIERVIITTDSVKINGEPRYKYDEEKCWTDDNAVTYVYLTCSEGVLHYRFYWNGYARFEEVVGKEAKLGLVNPVRTPKSSRVTQFAIDSVTNMRIIDAGKSAYARKKYDEFATAGKQQGGDPTTMEGNKIWIDLTYKRVWGEEMAQILEVAKEEKGFTNPTRSEIRSIKLKLPRAIEGEAKGAF